MSESTGDLKTLVEAADQTLTEVSTLTGQISEGTTRMVDEAARHGWHGMANRMQDVVDALDATGQHLTTCVNAVDMSVDELGAIGAEISASAVMMRLATASTQLIEAETAIQGAADTVEEATQAAAEVEQECVKPPPLTYPSRQPDAAWIPEGIAELVSPRAKADKKEAVRHQNETARKLAAAGYRIRQIPEHGTATSADFEIEGHIFDCYTPEADTSADSIRNRLKKKMSNNQAHRFVVNLDSSELAAESLRDLLWRKRPSRLPEVLVVKHGVISRVWP